MSLSSDDRNSIVLYRIERAYSTLEEAEMVAYLQKELNRREYLMNKGCDDDYPFSLSNKTKDYSTHESGVYKEYKSFVDKITKYMSESVF